MSTFDHSKTLFITIGIFLLMSINPVNGLKLPNEYDYNQCELIAKDVQQQYGGNLIWIAPKSWDTGEWILGDYSSHIVNYVYVRGNNKSFYIDFGYQRIFSSKEELKNWYSYEYSGYDAEIFNIGKGERPPYNLIWYV